MSGWRGQESDGRVRERFVRVVGLPLSPDDSVPDEQMAMSDGQTSVSDGQMSVSGGQVGDGSSTGDRGALSAASARQALARLDPGRRGVRALAVVAVVAVGIAGFVAWRARPSAEPVPIRVSASGTAAVPSSSGGLVVAVAGRVQRPGLVRLPGGSRVADAIEAVGGVLPGTDLSFVNLARKLVDGELVVVGVTPPPGLPDAGGGGSAAAGPVNLNTANVAQLESLPGVGPVMAQHIIDYRSKHGGFKSVAELRQVEGVGDSRYAQLKELVTV
jgi:competence protein ComEA